MTENRTRAPIIGDRWLIIIALTLVAITAWNSRYALIPVPEGFARYANHGISFLYPDDLDLWEVAIYDNGSVVLDGSRTISRDWGCVGWNSGNVDFKRPGREGYFQESSVIWLSTDPPKENGVKPHMFYTSMEVNSKRRDRECNITKGETGFITHRNHVVNYEYFNYSIRDYGAEHNVIVYGIVAGFYCPKTGRTIELYYLDIYDADPVYDQKALDDIFKFYLNSVHCH